MFEAPLVELDAFGFYFDDIDLLSSNQLRKLGGSKEATAWLDTNASCVYKLFDLRIDGGLGEKLVLGSARSLMSAVERAQMWRMTGKLPSDDLYAGISDDEL